MVSPAPTSGIVYIAVCRNNGKAYVGQTTHGLYWRIKRHWGDNKATPFSRAIRKHGRDNFDFAVLGSYTTREDLDQAEQEWIASFGSIVPDGYNLTTGGGGTSGYSHSPEARAKRSTMSRVAWADPEYRAKLTGDNHWTKQPENQVIIAAISEAAKEQHRSGVLGGYRGGGIKTKESKEKASASFKKVWSDPEYRARMVAVHTGKPSPFNGVKRGPHGPYKKRTGSKEIAI